VFEGGGRIEGRGKIVWGQEKDDSPTSLVSGFSSSAPPDEATSSTLTVASGLSTTISGVAFLVGEGDFEREAEDISGGQKTRDGDIGRGWVQG
jgi:hypothetical protein